MRVFTGRQEDARGALLEVDAPNVYGYGVTPSEYGPRGVLSVPEVSRGGNVIAHAGRELDARDGRWEKAAHIVLTPQEARGVALELLAAAAVADTRRS